MYELFKSRNLSPEMEDLSFRADSSESELFPVIPNAGDFEHDIPRNATLKT